MYSTCNRTPLFDCRPRLMRQHVRILQPTPPRYSRHAVSCGTRRPPQNLHALHSFCRVASAINRTNSEGDSLLRNATQKTCRHFHSCSAPGINDFAIRMISGWSNSLIKAKLTPSSYHLRISVWWRFIISTGVPWKSLIRTPLPARLFESRCLRGGLRFDSNKENSINHRCIVDALSV